MEPLMLGTWRDRVRYSSEGPLPCILRSDDQLRVLVAGLTAGQRIPAHAEALAVYHILEGDGWITVGGERHEVHAGATLVVPAGMERGIEASSPLAFLAVRVAAAIESERR